MNEKCEHKTSTTMADHGNVTLSECTWGCGAILIAITDDQGISHEFTAEEVLSLEAEIERLRRANAECLIAIDRLQVKNAALRRFEGIS